MANIHPNEQAVTLNVYPEIWGDMKCIVVERKQYDIVIDSISISDEEEAEDFVTAFLRSMSVLNWEG